MDWAGWALFGLVATAALTVVMVAAQLAGLTRLDLSAGLTGLCEGSFRHSSWPTSPQTRLHCSRPTDERIADEP